jgi:hypothetical protein
VLELELTDYVTAPCGEETDDEDDYASGLALCVVDLLKDPGTPPVAESTVGIARTPRAIMVLSMMIVALILLVQQRTLTETHHPTDL